MRNLYVIIALLFVAVPLHGQSITLRNAAGTVSVTVPARGELRCTYYQPIALYLRNFGEYSWGKTGDPPVVGDVAANYAPRFRWEYLGDQYLQSITAMAFGAFPSAVSGSSGAVSTSTLGRAVTWGDVGIGSQNYRWWLVAGPNAYPFCTNLGSSFNWQGPTFWPAEIAGSYSATGTHFPSDRTTFEVWVDPNRYASGSAGLVAVQDYAKPDAVFGEVFLWLRFEVFPLDVGGTGESGMGDCCEEILDALDDIEDALDSIALNLSGWREEWQVQNVNLMDWKAKWQLQDEWLREALTYDGVGSPGSPEVAEQAPIDLPYSMEDIGGGARTTLSTGIVAMPTLGIESDATEPPVWTFTLPSNPLASMNGMSSVDRVFTIDFGAVPAWETVILGLHAVIYLFAALWSMTTIWEELRIT